MSSSATTIDPTLAAILIGLAPLGPESIPLVEALGRILAANVVVSRPVPGFTHGGTTPAIVQAGKPLRPGEIGLLAALGIDEARVVRRPRAAVLAVGDDLLAPGAPPAPGKVYDGDSPLLAAAISSYGGTAQVVHIAHGTRDSLRLRLAEAIAQAADLIVVTAAKPAFQPLRQLLHDEGQLRLDGPTDTDDPTPLYGALAGVPLLGLPSEPALALACAERYLRPVVRHLAGIEATAANADAGPHSLASPL